MTKNEALKLAPEALEELNETTSYWWQEVDEATVKKIDPAITAIKQALAAPVQEPVAWMDPTDGAIIKAHVFKDGLPPKGWKPIGFIDAPPAAQRQWTPMSKELLSSQVHWLYKQMWIAMKDGSVMTGVYEWRQGRYPDRLLLDGTGDVWAYEAEYVMPVVQPEHPNKLKEKNT